MRKNLHHQSCIELHLCASCRPLSRRGFLASHAADEVTPPPPQPPLRRLAFVAVTSAVDSFCRRHFSLPPHSKDRALLHRHSFSSWIVVRLPLQSRYLRRLPSPSLLHPTVSFCATLLHLAPRYFSNWLPWRVGCRLRNSLGPGLSLNDVLLFSADGRRFLWYRARPRYLAFVQHTACSTVAIRVIMCEISAHAHF